MLNLGADCPIWLCTQATDMRRSFDGLSAMVRNHMGADPTGGHWFVFVNRRRTLLKVLAFDGDGYWIWSKRLEAGQFAAPGRSAAGKRAPDSARCRSLLMTRTDLLALLEGIDFVVKKRRKRYKKAA